MGVGLRMSFKGGAHAVTNVLGLGLRNGVGVFEVKTYSSTLRRVELWVLGFT